LTPQPPRLAVVTPHPLLHPSAVLLSQKVAPAAVRDALSHKFVAEGGFSPDVGSAGSATFVQETTYRYTGVGVDVHSKSSFFMQCLRTTCSLGLVVSVLALVVILLPPPAPAATGPFLYDCGGSSPGEPVPWSRQKLEWCCGNMGVACEQLQPTREPDCSLGDAAGWTDEKRHWCCGHGGRGCPSDAAPGLDCEGASEAWSEGRRRRCCEEERKGCADAPVAA